jgi:hypothetical protein
MLALVGNRVVVDEARIRVVLVAILKIPLRFRFFGILDRQLLSMDSRVKGLQGTTSFWNGFDFTGRGS